MMLMIAYDIKRTGGIERLSKQVYQCLKNEGIDVEIVTTQTLFQGWIGKLISRLFFMSKLLFLLPKADSVMVMHVLLLKSVEWASWLSSSKYKKICWTYGIDVWGSAFEEHKQSLSKCDRLITISSFGYNKLLTLEDKLKIVHPMADLIAPNIQPRPFPEGLHLLTVSRMSKWEGYKGHRLVLNALSLLEINNKLPIDLRWDIIGEGDEKQDLINYAKSLNLENRVIFHGALSDDALRTFYANCSLFIMPSSYGVRKDGSATGEGFGIVYVEAALAGRPSIACKEGGQTDIIKDGETGWLVDSNSKNIATTLELLISNQNLIYEAGKKARRHALNNFSYSRFSSNLLTSITK